MKCLLVLVDDSESCEARVRLATRLAQDLGCRLQKLELESPFEAASLRQHIHCSDLVVVGREPRGLAAQVVMTSARPMLMVPGTGGVEQIGQRVLVAWDDSREASRALGDALPILRHSSRVEVVWWREQGSDDKAVHARLDAVHRWLRLHGVASHIYLESLHGHLAAAMLSRASQIGADLVVMGAYGHARWAQRLLGGATREMLDAMTVPVLMSH